MCAVAQLFISKPIYLEILLLFIRGTRVIDWNLHLSAFRAMIPWFFACDRTNYARYGSAYWLEMTLLDMTLLDKTHPGWAFYCLKLPLPRCTHFAAYLIIITLCPLLSIGIKPEISSNFAVQRQNVYGFSAVAGDQTIEQTVNRDSKTKGGLTGFSMNPASVHRWLLSQPERAAITRKCKNIAGMDYKPR